MRARLEGCFAGAEGSGAAVDLFTIAILSSTVFAFACSRQNVHLFQRRRAASQVLSRQMLVMISRLWLLSVGHAAGRYLMLVFNRPLSTAPAEEADTVCYQVTQDGRPPAGPLLPVIPWKAVPPLYGEPGSAWPWAIPSLRTSPSACCWCWRCCPSEYPGVPGWESCSWAWTWESLSGVECSDVLVLERDSPGREAGCWDCRSSVVGDCCEARSKWHEGYMGLIAGSTLGHLLYLAACLLMWLCCSGMWEIR